jgi:molybdopterin-containing oxidoreductase family iron-sulfur binding subunit
MSKKRTDEGFPHSPDPIDGVEARIRRDANGDVTVSFGDGSDDLRMNRREFLRVGGVAAATATMAGAACRNPVEKIVPYVDRPETVRIGFPDYYTTVCQACPAQCGALIHTRAGRPIKMEGNPSHPIGKGALCARGQSSYMDAYDPDRARGPLEISADGAHAETTWEDLDKTVGDAIKNAASGGTIRLLTNSNSGPSRHALAAQIKGAVNDFEHYTYDPLHSEAMLAANEQGYGARHIPHYRFDLADLIVSLGSDFLGTWLSPVEFTKQFSARRDPDAGEMNRLVAFEGHVSVTGMNADDRHRVRPTDLHLVALALAHVVLVKEKSGPLATNAAAMKAVQPFSPKAVSKRTGIAAETFDELGKELAEHAGKSIIVAGGLASAHENGAALETAVNLLNAALQNDGRTLERQRPSHQASGLGDITQLVEEMNGGNVDVLIIDGANPVYSGSAGIGFEKALEKVKLVVSTSDRVDETGAKADYLAPSGHALESWGDAEPINGLYSIQQPGLTPLWDTRTLESSLLTWFGATKAVPALEKYLPAPELPPGNRPGAGIPTDPGPWYRFLRENWRKNIFARANSLAGFEQFWQDTLRTGSVELEQTVKSPMRFRPSTGLAALPSAVPKGDGGSAGDLSKKEVRLFAPVALYDGRQANNGRLQELPDPISKHVWGSFALVSPKTFREAGLEMGQHIEVTVNDVSGRFPVIMQPGLHDDVIALPLGYGRSAAGAVANDVGVNTFQFTSAKGTTHFAGIAASAKATSDGEDLAVVQGAQVLDTHRRPILSSTTLPEYEEDPEAGIHTHPGGPDMWASHDYSELKWGMSVDLSKCTGCSACVTACMEENNIPVVGRQGILEGREMHWMRIDRYYELPPEAAKLQASVTSDPMFDAHPVVAFGEYMDNPRVVTQPMMCQHCEHAPCETVCPVSATMHSEDGLNQMAYNRCVGTRYCSNNCPFKVRRFNWYNYTTDRSDSFVARLYPEVNEHGRLNAAEPLHKGSNPDVTVRARGVMEKCTFCVQRIRRAGVQLRKEGRSEFRDGDVVTACQQTCPADAISFGNLSDAESTVAKLHASKRALSPLAELGVHSSVGYLTAVFNTEKGAHAAEGDAHGAEGGGHGEGNSEAADHG